MWHNTENKNNYPDISSAAALLSSASPARLRDVPSYDLVLDAVWLVVEDCQQMTPLSEDL